MKKIIKNPIISFIIGAVLFGSIGPVLAYRLTADQILYTPTNNSSQITNAQIALDNFYQKTLYGDANETDILNGKTAVVQGKKVIGTLTGFTSLSDTEEITPNSSSTNLNGYYNLSDYSVSCSKCTESSYIPTDYEIKYNISFTSSNRVVTIKKVTINNGEEVEQTATSSLGDIKSSVSAVGGGCGYSVSIVNNGPNNISYGQKIYTPGTTIASFCSSVGNYNSGYMYVSSYFNE